MVYTETIQLCKGKGPITATSVITEMRAALAWLLNRGTEVRQSTHGDYDQNRRGCRFFRQFL